MFRHILVPLDGSARAEQVLPIAARLAKASNGTITLLRVMHRVREALAYGFVGPYIAQDAFEGEVAEGKSYLDEVLRCHSTLAGRAIEQQVLIGDPAESILASAREQDIDLIVMSSHGYSGIKRWLLGSVAEAVARHALVPVLILRDGEPLRTHTSHDGTRVVRAVVPLDASAHSQDAIPPAATLVAALSSPGKGALHLTQIVVLPEQASQGEREELLQSARQNLDAIGQSVRDGLVANVGPDLGVTLSWSVSVDGDIAEGIVRIAECGETTAVSYAERCDLIALTTHGLTGSQKWVVGSITERVLHATRLPLLVVHPADMLARERQQREHAETSV